VSDEDYERVAQFKWFASQSGIGHTFYARRNVWIGGRRGAMLMHRFILNAQPGQLVDHEDHCGLHNERTNIRVTTSQGNNRNRKPRAHSSPYKGVYWDNYHGAWRAVIRVNRRVIYLGSSDDDVEMARRYDAKARELFGEFAFVNFPHEGEQGCAR
jgi:hypothetical protein